MTRFPFRPVFGRRALPDAFHGPLDVPLSKIASQRAGLADRDADPSGANLVQDAGSTEHPVPVILVHGTLDNAVSAWHSLAPLLRNAGFSVFTVNVGRLPDKDLAGGLGPIADSAAELADRVDEVRTLTGSEAVDIVGHSQGGVVAHDFIRHGGGAGTVRELVGLGVPNAGIQPGARRILETLTGGSVPAIDDLVTGGVFQQRLQATGVTSDEVHYTMIGSRFDEAVLPHSSLYLPGADNVTNIRLQDRYRFDAADHFALPYDPHALYEVVRALDPSVDWQIPATVVAPYNGGALLSFA
ncbi:MAG: esterase/lipase family protein [Mycobacteriaceae bacterium]|uniref:esterase/lipase family protein n=1 Tax=Corynebacterium sp. TaxID=1720 RepID=UPI003F9D59FB